jgi:hypothetical protein
MSPFPDPDLAAAPSDMPSTSDSGSQILANAGLFHLQYLILPTIQFWLGQVWRQLIRVLLKCPIPDLNSCQSRAE